MELTGTRDLEGAGPVRLHGGERPYLRCKVSKSCLAIPLLRKKSIVSRRYGRESGAMLMSAALHCQAADSSDFYDARALTKPLPPWPLSGAATGRSHDARSP